MQTPSFQPISLSVINSFNGLYGIDLDRQVKDTHWTLQEAETIQGKDFLDMTKPVEDFEGKVVEISYRIGFEYVIRTINHFVPQQLNDSRFKSEAEARKCYLFLHRPGASIFKALTNIAHPDFKKVSFLPQLPYEQNFVQMIQVIFHVLTDKNQITGGGKTASGQYFVQV